VYHPGRDAWARWQVLEMPPGDKFNFCRNACAQWLVKDDGHLLVPLYFGRNAKEPYSVTVAECSFDGERITYLRHGDELTLNVERGLVEPSLVRYGGRYYLTLRNDRAAYVTVSGDGLKWVAGLWAATTRTSTGWRMAKGCFSSIPAAVRITTTSRVTGRPCSSPAWTRIGSPSSDRASASSFPNAGRSLATSASRP
jgi:hypothetical protein